MANDIKQKIVLEGEKEYNRALAEAKRNLKTLRSELKAETAELGANATAQQKNETKIKSLQKQIKEQEKIVKTYQAALKEVKEKYGDNAEAVSKWEVKLNEARSTLANMKNSLEDVGEGFKSVNNNASMATVATKSVADSLGNLSEIGTAISDSIESVFTGLISSMKATISEIWSMIADTAAKANNWTDLASYYGSTASEIERMNKAIEWSQGNFGDFTNLLNQLSWGGKGKKITEWFGVSDVNYENKLEYAMAVLQEMKELSKSDPSKLGDAMEDIFGARKSQQIMWFVSNLENIQENLREYDEHGYGMGDDALRQMNDVWLELGEIEGKWDSLKQKFAAGFGTVTLDIMTNVSGSLDALSDYFNAGSDEERQAALDKLEENILAMFTKAKEAIEKGIELLDTIAEDLKKSGNPTAQALGNILSGLVDALKWLTEDNMANVVKALEVLAAFWLTGKGFAMGTKILEIVKNINLIKAFGVGSGAASGVGSGLGSGITGAGVGMGAGAAAAKALPQIQLGAGNAVPVGDWFTHNTALGRQATNFIMGALGLAKPFADEDVLAGIKQNAKTFGSDWDSNVITQLGKNNILYWDMINKWQVQAEEYAQQQAELEQQRLEELQRKTEPTENWEFGEDWSMDEILQWVDRQNTQRTDGGNSGNQDGLTSADAKNMTDAVNKMPNAVAKGVSGIRVYMDGQVVGNLVAPYVSAAIATQIV